MKKIKLTTREKVIIGGAVIIVGVLGYVNIKKTIQIGSISTQYNNLANQICSGGAWKPEIGPKTFKLIKVAECCGKGCTDV